MWTALGLLKLITRSRDQPFQPAMAMIGVKPGATVVVLGARQPDLAAALAVVTGLNGQTTVVDRATGAADAVATAARQAGALVDFVDAPCAMTPLDSGTADVVVLPSGLAALGTDAPLVLAEAIRLARGGGRITVCEPVPRPGLFRLAQSAPVTDPAHVAERLTAAGLRAARHLGTLDGIAFVEAAKAK